MSYDNSMNEKVYRLALLGCSDLEIADFFDVAESTVWDWKRRYPEFGDALRRGKMDADAKVAEALFKRATGYSHPDVDIRVVSGEIVKTDLEKHYPPDTTAIQFWLKNRTKHSQRAWVDISRTELTGKDGQEIRTLNLSKVDMSKLSDNELALLEKLALESNPELNELGNED